MPKTSMIRLEMGWLYFVIYIWSRLFGVIAPMQVWSLANHLLTTRQAKRLYGFVGSGGILGGNTGGFLAAVIAETRGTEVLLLLMAAGLGGSMALVFSITRRRPHLSQLREQAGDSMETPRPSFTQSMRWITASRYLLIITALVLLLRVVSGIVDYQFKAAASDSMASKDELTAFFGYFYVYLGLASFGIQLLLTRRILERLGVLVGLVLLPGFYLLGSEVFFLFPGLVAAIGLKGSGMLVKHSVAKSSLELLYLPLSGQMKYATKSFIDTAVWRISDGIGGVILLPFATTLMWTPSELVWVSLPLLLGWIATSYWARVHYVVTLRSSFRRRVLDPEKALVQWREPATREELRTSLKSQEESEVLHSLEIAEWVELKDLGDEVVRLTRHPSYRVRERALMLLMRWEIPLPIPEIEALLNDEHLEVRTAAANCLATVGSDNPEEKLQTLLNHPVPSVRAAAVLCLMQNRDGGEIRETCREVLEAILSHDDPDSTRARRDVAQALCHPSTREIAEPLIPRLLEDPDQEVRRSALRSVTRYTNPKWIPLLVVQLGIRRTRGAVLEALASYGPAVIPPLSGWLTDPAWPAEVRKRVAKLFGRLNTEEVLPYLLGTLKDPQPELRYAILKSLHRIHRRHPEWALPNELFLAVLRGEVEGAYLLLAGLHQVESSDKDLRDGEFLRWAMTDRFQKSLDRIFGLLGLLYSWSGSHSAYLALRGGHTVSQANAVEYLDQTLKGDVKTLVLPLVLPELDLTAKLNRGERSFPRLRTLRKTPWADLLRQPDFLLRTILLTSLGSDGAAVPKKIVAELAHDGNTLVRQAAEQALGSREPSILEKQIMSPMSTVQKLKALQLVDIFTHTDPDGLIHLAVLSQEQRYGKGDIIFSENDPSDNVFCLLDGGVELLQEGKGTMHRVDPGQAFGYLDILDRKPRLFTAKAAEESKVLRINTDDFYDELADHIEIVQGVFGALGSHLRKVLLEGAPSEEAVRE